MDVKRLAHRGCNSVEGVGGPEVVSKGGRWGERAAAWARKLHGCDSLWQHHLACEDSGPGRQGCCCLWSLFAPPSVLHLRALLSVRHWIHLEWFRDPVHFLKTQDPFSKQKRGPRTERDDVWRGRLCAWIGPRVSQQHRLALMKRGCSVITHNQANGEWCECGWGAR